MNWNRGRIPLLGKGGARGGSVNFQNDSARMLTKPPLTPPLPRRGMAHDSKFIHTLYDRALLILQHPLRRRGRNGLTEDFRTPLAYGRRGRPGHSPLHSGIDRFTMDGNFS